MPDFAFAKQKDEEVTVGVVMEPPAKVVMERTSRLVIEGTTKGRNR